MNQRLIPLRATTPTTRPITVGKDGGFILDGAIGIPDEAKTENVRTMFDAARRYAP